MDEENDRLRLLLRQLLIPTLKLMNAYAIGESNGGSVRWEDLDEAHAYAHNVVKSHFDLQKCPTCGQFFVPNLTRCGCD